MQNNCVSWCKLLRAVRLGCAWPEDVGVCQGDAPASVHWYVDRVVSRYANDFFGANCFLNYSDIEVVMCVELLLLNDNADLLDQLEVVVDRRLGSHMGSAPWPLLGLLHELDVGIAVEPPLADRLAFLINVLGRYGVDRKTDWTAQYLRDIIPDWATLTAAEHTAREAFHEVVGMTLVPGKHGEQFQLLQEVRAELVQAWLSNCLGNSQ